MQTAGPRHELEERTGQSHLVPCHVEEGRDRPTMTDQANVCAEHEVKSSESDTLGHQPPARQRGASA